VEELSALVRLEEEYPGLTPESPFNFFLEELREKQYVPVRGETGLNLFPYRVAAGAPFAAHFVLGASQQQASVIYRSLKFLRQDKRKALGLRDEDASAVFFRLYRPGSFKTARGDFVSHTFISASERTFSGWAIPHSRFAGRTLRMSPPPGDPFREERAWWACGGAFPRRLFRVQRGGFERWHGLLCPAGRADRLVMANMLRAPLEEAGGAGGLLRGRIDAVQRGGAPGEKALFKVSATDLNGFFYCPLSWLWKKIFRLEGEELEARLLDDASLGLLYHEILKNLYDHIRREDRVFKPENLESYRQWAEESTARAAENYPAFQGPLAVPLLRSMARTIAGKVQTLLGIDARYFPGYTMPELEAVLEIRTGELLLNGRLDRVSVSPEGDPVIIDYKTGKSPSKTESTETFDKALEDFQIPLYVKLYEETRGIKAGGAFFISINQEELTAVIGSPGRKRGHRREDYQPTLDALEDYIGEFAGRVLSLDFVPVEVSLKNCAGCDYRGVCRRTYSLNAPEEAPRVFRNNP
jgi:RecB family exonuclease